MRKVTKAVIPAAGFGTRFLPATKAVPKEMIPIVDTPTIQYIVEEAVNSGIKDILIITGRGKDAIMNHFDNSFELETVLERENKTELLKAVREVSQMVDVHFIRQKEQKGLGHAVSYAKQFAAGEPIAVMLGDDVVVNDKKPCLKQMIDKYEELGGSILGVQTVDHSQVSKYGIVDGEKISDRTYKVNSLVEKPRPEDAPTDVAILGRYIITPGIFECLERTPKGAGGEIQLTDALFLLAEHEPVYAYDFEGKRYDVGNKMGFLQATVEFALRREDLRDEFSEYLKNLNAQL
ncbi:MAG: UTP--glucose-1-phosphate uridylyltransferase GalU [Clostridia bacterium]|nr:UTP--glucose-1-phosphate uridylyltransferase GalU [Clostridia bacterium]